jgi:hypothetical protein
MILATYLFVNAFPNKHAYYLCIKLSFSYVLGFQRLSFPCLKLRINYNK